MKKLAVGLLAGIAVLAAAALAVSVWVSRPLFDETLDTAAPDTLRIASASAALTFARGTVDGRERLLLVTGSAPGAVTGVDLTAALGTAERDPLAVFRALGYDALLALTTAGAPGLTVPTTALGLPLDAPEKNIGVGLNYREHAAESQLDEEPFLFPKFAQPTPFRSDVAKAGSTLLDYEAELGLVALDDLRPGAPPPTLGLVLANEVTDRWALVRNFKRGEPMGTTGFADGKSRDGFAPIGPLLVVPRDLVTFYRDIELRLYVNGRLRQHEKAGAMLWPPPQIVAEVFARAAVPFAYRGGSVRLLDQPDRIAAGTVIFSGTPAGVIFKPLNLWNPWVYLRPGDEVLVRADFLGTIRNRIVE